MRHARSAASRESKLGYGFFKGFQLKERLRMEFRAELYNIWNHAQFYSVDGNISDGTGRLGWRRKYAIRDRCSLR